jgi:hypothetical protein
MKINKLAKKGDNPMKVKTNVKAGPIFRPVDPDPVPTTK